MPSDHFARLTTSPNGKAAWRSGMRDVTVNGLRSCSIAVGHFASQGAIAPWYPRYPCSHKAKNSITKRRKTKSRNKKRVRLLLSFRVFGFRLFVMDVRIQPQLDPETATQPVP
jgi:hypothetical protein